MWAQYRQGVATQQIARNLGRHNSLIYGQLEASGGIQPAPRRRAAMALDLVEREEISRGLANGLSARTIAHLLCCSHTTVSREIKRNGGREQYRAVEADALAWKRARRPKLCLLALQGRLRSLVAFRLRCGWSPKQIALRLKRSHPVEPNMQVSHETIYRTLFVQSRGALNKELKRSLRTKRNIRRGRKSTLRRAGRGQIVDALPISERPASVEDRAVAGHWEGDLLMGIRGSQVITLVERASRFTVLIKIPNKETTTVVAALIKQVKKLPRTLRRSLTWDRGLELASHKDFTVATDVKVYFCDPSSPWQRPTNENTNGLLREYLPKNADLSKFSQPELDKVALRLNTRPRIILDAETPAERLSSMVH